MKVFDSNTEMLPKEYRGGVVALGFFDGIHTGHLKLIGEAKRLAKEKGTSALVYTFDISPRNLGDEIRVFEITPHESKISVMESEELDAVYFDRFDENMKNMTGEEFIRHIVHEKLGAAHVVVGFNYSFGVRAACHGDELRKYCSRFGIGVTQLPPHIANGSTPVSSTLIRSLITSGDMEEVTRLLGRAFFIDSLVVKGQQIGSVMDVKTINQEFSKTMIKPKRGVYISRSIIDGKVYKSMTNVGTRPTVNDGDDIRVETHIMGFNANIYGKVVRVEFLKYIRDERKFENLEALKAQLMKDSNTTMEYFKTNFDM